MIPYRYDPEHIAPANQAPRCEHIRLNGQRCGAPARRGERLCHFHDGALHPNDSEPTLPFIEDATSLQFALMQVMRMLQIGHVEYKRCALLLYSLQIACANLKNFMAEQPQLEISQGETPQPKHAADAKQNKEDEEPALPGLVPGMLAQGPKGDPGAEQILCGLQTASRRLPVRSRRSPVGRKESRGVSHEEKPRSFVTVSRAGENAREPSVAQDDKSC